VDVHDLGAEDFDVLLTDITDKVLRGPIAQIAGIPYLKKATREEADRKPDVSRGFLYGFNRDQCSLVLSVRGSGQIVCFSL
jgi:hypothetical protein